MPIESVAAAESILLQFVPYDTIKRGGLCAIQAEETSHLFVSSADPDWIVESRLPAAKALIKLIVVAEDYNREGERIPIEETFWHEYFHVNWSPDLEPYDPLRHEYLSHGVLDRRDESNADLFTAAVLIDSVNHDDVLRSICERNRVSARLAQLAMDVERSSGLFSRTWTPKY